MLKNILWLSCITFFLSCTPGIQHIHTSLFDGESLSGWEGKPEFFRVEEGAIIAGSLEDTIPRNEFLCTENTYSDFELRLEAKLIGEGQNAGVQFRSKRIPDDHEVIGYQYDMGKSSQRLIWASLYDESRRKRFLIQPPEEQIQQLLIDNDWNELIIHCKGPEIRFSLNGTEVLHYTEPVDSISQSGKICLQIHSGLPTEAYYRNISIKSL